MLLGATTITLRRVAAQSVGSDGRGVDGSSSDTEIMASVQPAQGEDLQVLPEGLRSRRTIKVYTETELRTADQQAGTAPDKLVLSGLSGIDDGTYEVQTVQPWYALLPHHKALATLVQEAA